jgi:hypothetical protein
MDEDTDLNASRAQLEEGREQMDSAFSQAAGMLKDAEAELAKARKEFNEQRDEALENAGLDGVITIQTVSGLIGAQNIAMPAGYVYDADDEQVLVRVGDKFDTLDGVRRLKLFKLDLDSVDEVRLLDVARVELTDDREDVFTKLNGQDGILLSMDKQSTYSTADVAKTVMAKAKELAEANPNLHIVDLMNQGEYISIIVDSVLNNLLSGGGLVSMLKSVCIICISSCYSGMFSGTGLLDGIQNSIEKLSRRLTPFGGILVTAVLTAMIACNQTLGIMLTHQLCGDTEKDPQRMALALENTSVVVNPLIPWSIASAVPLSSAGAPAAS